MLTLNDGRNELWQWDTNRTLSVDADCSQVHFSNKVFGRSIDVDVIDGVAIIPDILLQTDKDLSIWAFVGAAENGYTKISKTFKVNRRNKPADYVFTPPDQTSLEEIKKEIEYLKSVQDPDAIKNAVEDYLEQNPVESPVQSVNRKSGEVELTAEDVGAISQDDLQKATNEALAQAKASGEFDGKDGQDGRPGVTPEISIGTVETLEAESEATASITGTPEKPVLNLGIPRGPAGEGSAIAVSGASVGQTVKIAAVDTNGVPTAWEAVDLPGEKKWELIETIVVEEEVASVKVNFPEGYCDIVVNGELRAPPESSMLVIYWHCTALVDETEKADQLAAFWDYYPENKPCFFEFRIQIQEMGGVTYYKISGTLQTDSKTHRSNLQSTGWMSESVNGNAITRATCANITREIPADSKITVWGRK